MDKAKGMTTREILEKANIYKSVIANYSADEKNRALKAMAAALLSNCDSILSANALDISDARGVLSDVMLDRLLLDESRINAMAEGIENTIRLDDPADNILEERKLESGLLLTKVSVPMGVVAIIYESRPNVTSDAAALCFKSGNVCVLRSGKEAYRTSFAIVNAMQEGLKKEGFPRELINIVTDTSRESANELMKARGLVDLLIPRGGAGLIRACVNNSTVPCIETGVGICSVYVDKHADLYKAIKIIDNAKTSRPSVCNAAEQLLVHKDVADLFLPMVYEMLVTKKVENLLTPVELRGDETAAKIIDVKAANEADFDTEFLDYILAIKVVDSVEDATNHIREHSTMHSEAIISEDENAINFFTSHVDSAAVYVNASTRFTDGGMFGLGCEMGISTQKLHARGPMGLSELTSYKYIIKGDGQIR